MTNESKILTMLENLTEDVGGMKQDIGSIKQGQERLELRMDGLEQDNISIHAELTQVHKSVRRIRKSVIRIENDQGQKINVLFDAFQANKDENTETRQRVSVLEERVDKHDFRLAALETAE
jgi:uncharacterized protein YoxC